MFMKYTQLKKNITLRPNSKNIKNTQTFENEENFRVDLLLSEKRNHCVMKIEKLNNFSENIYIVSVFVPPQESSDRVEVFQAIGFAKKFAVKKFTRKLKQKQSLCWKR